MARLFTPFLAMICVLSLLLVHTLAHDHDHHHHVSENHLITCGTAVKLTHKATSYQLFSTGVQWGSGSTEQVVTATSPQQSSPNNLFQILSAFDPKAVDSSCAHGEIVKCGQVVRLRHSTTNNFIRSSPHRAPVSGKQEVSAETKGDRTSENWTVECINGKPGDILAKNHEIKLKHVKTGNFLYTNKSFEFTPRNCRGCPILGHLEVSAHGSTLDQHTIWSFGEGFFIPANDNRIVYDYTDVKSKEPKVLYDASQDKAIKAATVKKDEKSSSHDEL